VVPVDAPEEPDITSESVIETAADGAADAEPSEAVQDATPEDLPSDDVAPLDAEVASEGFEASEVDAVVETTLPADLTACRFVVSDRVPIPEASGSALLDAAGTRILVVADSGNGGRAIVIERASGRARALLLPLGEGAGDDIEGLERAPDGRIFGLASNGFLRAWREAGDGFALVLGPTAISDEPAWVCDAFGVNCAANYEGLCLHPAPEATACAGWAASKATGELVCLRGDGDGYRLDPQTRIRVTEPERLSGCAYEPEPPYRLIAGGNLFAASALWQIELDPLGGPAKVREFQERGAGNQESLVLLPGGELQSYGDGQDFLADESPRVIFQCR